LSKNIPIRATVFCFVTKGKRFILIILKFRIPRIKYDAWNFFTKITIGILFVFLWICRGFMVYLIESG
jgi:hypothetical protein